MIQKLNSQLFKQNWFKRDMFDSELKLQLWWTIQLILLIELIQKSHSFQIMWQTD